MTIDAQTWLNQTYPDQTKRWQVKEIQLDQLLTGRLDLIDFTNYYLKVYLYPDLDYIQLEIVNFPQDNQREIIKLVDAQDYLEQWYPADGTCQRNKERLYWSENFGKRRGEITELDLSQQGLIGCLDLTGFEQLQELDCSGNKLNQLILPNPNQITIIDCYDNQLTDLTCFSTSPQLQRLNINNNNLTGSLQPLANCPQLTDFDCDNNPQLAADLQYLSASLEWFRFEYNPLIINQLLPFGNDLAAWQKAYHHQSTDPVEYQVENVIKLPEFIQKNYSSEPNLSKQRDYSTWALRDGHRFYWQEHQPVKQSLPLRLLDLSATEVVNGADLPSNTAYVILSYCWGQQRKQAVPSHGQDYPINLTEAGWQALNKAQEVWKNHLAQDNIDHIWIDNFCINQSDPIEKGQEVAGQKAYYSQAQATLIAIDQWLGEVTISEDSVKRAIKLITQDQWFTRSWCFQEGLLAKQSVFMFNDYLVDGRILAAHWGRGEYKAEYNPEGFFNSIETICYLTPLGASYGAQPQQNISLTLSQALAGINHRQQTVLVDKLYSLLGLLPYGRLVQAKYKDKDCACSVQERQNCDHLPDYDREDLTQALLKIVQAQLAQQGQLEITSEGDYQLTQGYLLPSLDQKNCFSQRLSKELKNKLIFTRSEQKLALSSGRCLVVEEVILEEEGWKEKFYYSIKIADWKFSIDSAENYQSRVGDQLIVQEDRDEDCTAILVQQQKIKVFIMKKWADQPAIEPQNLLITPEGQIEINQNPDLVQQLAFCQQRLRIIFWKVWEYEDREKINRLLESGEITEQLQQIIQKQKIDYQQVKQLTEQIKQLQQQITEESNLTAQIEQISINN